MKTRLVLQQLINNEHTLILPHSSHCVTLFSHLLGMTRKATNSSSVAVLTQVKVLMKIMNVLYLLPCYFRASVHWKICFRTEIIQGSRSGKVKIFGKANKLNWIFARY